MGIDQLHGILLELLVEFDRVCMKNDIKYSLAFGTLLGAERHGGFIPWDDDVDILMDRYNYELFCKRCDEDLGNEYFLQTKNSDKNYVYNISRLRKRNTTYILEKWKDSGIHQGVYIDIFPIDHIPNGRLAKAIQRHLIILLSVVRISRNPVIFWNGKKELGGIKKSIVYGLSCLLPQVVCGRIEDRVITKYNNIPTNMVGCICEGGVLYKMTKDMMPFRSEFLNEYSKVKFEGREFLSVKDHKGILEHWYGDWRVLPPIEERKSDHNPLVFDAENDYSNYV